MDNNRSLALLNSINDLYKIESSICISNNSEMFKAIEVSTGKSVLLIILKRRFNKNQDSEDISNFLDRLQHIKAIGTSLSSLMNFGVDRDGIGYSVCKISSVNSILSGNLNYREASRRFDAILQILVTMHKSNIVFGDISPNSFSVSRDGNIGSYILNGSYPSKNDITICENFELPNNQEPISKQSDIYRFGILCYKLFSNNAAAYPFDENGDYVPISVSQPIVPRYIDKAIKTCLQDDLEARFSDAVKLSEYINKEREELATSTDSSGLTPSNDEFYKVKVLNELAIREEQEEAQDRKKYVKIASLICAIIILLFALFIGSGKKENDALISASKQVVDKNDLAQKEVKLERIYDSEDPLMYVAMVNMASKAATPTERKLVEKYIIKRFKNIKYDNVVMVLNDFFSNIIQNDIPQFYEKFLLSLDKNFPIEKRITLFSELVSKNRNLIVDMSIALSEDAKDTKNYRRIFVKLLSDEFKTDIERRSYDALMISEYTSLGRYEKMLLERLTKLSDEDLVWLLPVFVKRNDKFLDNLIKIVTKRNLLDRIQTKFLSLVNKLHPPKDIKDILLKAGTTKVTSRDIHVISSWMNINKVDVFYVMLISLKDDSVLRREIFDAMSVLTLEDKTTENFIKYVKDNMWDDRSELAVLIPYIHEPTEFSSKEILSVLNQVASILKDESNVKKLLSKLAEISDIKIKKVIFENFYNELGVGVLINYLSYDDKNIKKLAIKGLKEAQIDDVIVSNLIIEKYEDETDEEIRNLYKENFWFIRKREL